MFSEDWKKVKELTLPQCEALEKELRKECFKVRLRNAQGVASDTRREWKLKKRIAHLKTWQSQLLLHMSSQQGGKR